MRTPSSRELSRCSPEPECFSGAGARNGHRLARISQPTYRDLSDGGTSHDCRPYLRVAIGEVRVSSGAGPFEFACTIEFVVRECTLPKPV